MSPTSRASRSAARLHRSILLAGLAWLVLAAARLPDVPVLAAESTTQPHIDVLTATGVVDNVMATYIEQGVAQGASGEAEAVIVTLNTPGGSLDATQRIVSALLEAPVPTIVWVAPSGGRAASAGTFITLVGPSRLHGARHEHRRGLAGRRGGRGADRHDRRQGQERRDRQYPVHRRGARQERRLGGLDRREGGLIDRPARPSPSAPSTASRRRSRTSATRPTARSSRFGAQPVTLELTDAAFVDVGMNPFQSIIHLLSDPNVAFILLTLGFYGLLFELQSPNFVTGILGAIALILAFIGFGSLPLNVAGLILIGLAVLLFVLETTVTSHGLLTVGGLVCFVLGAFTLYTAPGTPAAPDVAVATPLIVAMTAVTGGVRGAWCSCTVARVRRRSASHSRWRVRRRRYDDRPDGDRRRRPDRARTARRGVRGRRGVDGSREGRNGIAPGQPVRVVGQEDLTLVVESGPAAGAGRGIGGVRGTRHHPGSRLRHPRPGGHRGRVDQDRQPVRAPARVHPRAGPARPR